MNFEDIKQQMNSQNMDDQVIPNHISELKKTQLPIQKIRRNIKTELLTQIVIILLLFMTPGFIEMNPVARGIYFILIFITSLITIIYLLKINSFIKQTSNLSFAVKDVLVTTLYQLKLTLEVYKTAVISGSLLLPAVGFILIKGRNSIDESAFLNIITFNISFEKIIFYIIGYLVTAIAIYIVTNWWVDNLYGKYINDLENILEKLEY
ncbi:hypothetical protein SAMN05216480_10241 [Pustulibacterium marinum]|uniref:Uncharacterized protein n=1 Tax=Pustulibacterium marinum TaxID=1224947 RepID=A0A1I7FMQ7_9FLAO|nr:hypothetical protein [Pustulibacterium marinum]SFU37507.1 hypothetical protein SAMN05216480_10241 [Pustulibacterium marinum]